MESTLDKDTSFDGFTLFIYVVRKKVVHKDHSEIIPVITFSDWFKAVASLYGKQFGEDNRRFYTIPRVVISSCGISYCDNHNNNRDGCDTCNDLVEYYYGPIKNKRRLRIPRGKSGAHPILRRKQVSTMKNI